MAESGEQPTWHQSIMRLFQRMPAAKIAEHGRFVMRIAAKQLGVGTAEIAELNNQDLAEVIRARIPDPLLEEMKKAVEDEATDVG